jgi:putative transposase
MRKGRFSKEQIINLLKEHQAEIPVVEVCRKHGISDATFYTWRTKYGGMEGSDARKLKALEDERLSLENKPEHVEGSGSGRTGNAQNS